MATRKETERRSAARGSPPKTAPKTEKSPEELRRLISEAAYYRAKQRGFAPGHELEDWIQAEAEVMGRMNSPGRAA